MQRGHGAWNALAMGRVMGNPSTEPWMDSLSVPRLYRWVRRQIPRRLVELDQRREQFNHRRGFTGPWAAGNH